MSRATLSIDGHLYELSPEQSQLLESIRLSFLDECDKIAQEVGDDGHFRGFNNSYDPYSGARARFERSVREVVGAQV